MIIGRGRDGNKEMGRRQGGGQRPRPALPMVEVPTGGLLRRRVCCLFLPDTHGPARDSHLFVVRKPNLSIGITDQGAKLAKDPLAADQLNSPTHRPRSDADIGEVVVCERTAYEGVVLGCWSKIVKRCGKPPLVRVCIFIACLDEDFRVALERGRLRDGPRGIRVAHGRGKNEKAVGSARDDGCPTGNYRWTKATAHRGYNLKIVLTSCQPQGSAVQKQRTRRKEDCRGDGDWNSSRRESGQDHAEEQEDHKANLGQDNANHGKHDRRQGLPGGLIFRRFHQISLMRE